MVSDQQLEPVLWLHLPEQYSFHQPVIFFYNSIFSEIKFNIILKMVKQKYIMTLKKQLCVSLYMYQTLMIPVKRNSISFNQHKTSEISFYLKSSVLIQKKKKLPFSYVEWLKEWNVVLSIFQVRKQVPDTLWVNWRNPWSSNFPGGPWCFEVIQGYKQNCLFKAKKKKKKMMMKKEQ